MLDSSNHADKLTAFFVDLNPISDGYLTFSNSTNKNYTLAGHYERPVRLKSE